MKWWKSAAVLASLLLAAGCSDGSSEQPDGGSTDLAAVPDSNTYDLRVDDAAAPDTVAGDVEAEAETEVPGYPEHTFVHKLDAPEMTKVSDLFIMDIPTQYRTTDKLPVLDVRCMSGAGGYVWAGTAQGLFLYNEAADSFQFQDFGNGVVHAVTDISRNTDSLGRIAVLTEGALVLYSPDGDQPFILAPDGVFMFISVELNGDTLWLGALGGGLWTADLTDDNPMPVPLGQEAFTVVDIAVDDGGGVWTATPNGLRKYEFEDPNIIFFSAELGSLPDDDVRAVVWDAENQLTYAATATGISRLVDSLGSTMKTGLGKLPYDDILSLDAGGGRLLMGHGVGATSAEGNKEGLELFERYDHYCSGRWLPDNRVSGVAVDHEGRMWLGTPKGITRIDWTERTLNDKAEYHEALQGEHFWRMDGFVPSDVGVDDEWNPTSWHTSDFDNDGLWTQMQIGAWCYAHAVTGDDAYYQKARKAMDVMMLQIDIPAVSFEAAGMTRGFITRSLVRDDEGTVYVSKTTQDNWHLVEDFDGHDYYWKDDTSSDEYAGHYYGYPLFYDLCAKTDEERQKLADYAALAASYIIDNDYRLIDLDGEKTGFGHWYPERIGAAADGLEACMEAAKEAENMFELVTFCFASWHGEGWLNSIEILGTLLAAYHMTGDTKFYDAYDELIAVHGYDRVAMAHDETLTVVDPGTMNHSDHELAMLAYQTLIRYEPNDERRTKWIESLLFLYEWEKTERNPLWAAFVTLAAGPEQAEMEAALQSLREMPDDRREWMVDNSHRKDAGDWPDDRFGDPQFDRVFPYDEIRTVWWNGSLYEKTAGGSPKSISGPVAWLLPYWALRYAGVIGE